MKPPFLSLSEKHYRPADIEERIYQLWETAEVFVGGKQPDRPSYSIVIPPPNVTGRLHMGHALNNTIQDVLARYKRMDGFDVCWVPGTDHAGISTQSVVKKQLQAEGINYRELGRDETIARIWQWKERFGNTIIQQLKRLGCSCDWSRTAFTMDETRSAAVLRAFKELYDAGLIYRGKRIVNWCPVDQTALSSDETYTKEGGEPGALWHVRYQVDGLAEGVVIATTRPETILGDTAIAVNPDDERYRHLIGKQATVPLVERAVPIIGDSYVDPGFGSGCLKVTPAHDPNDFEIGERHGLPAIDIMNDDATLNDQVPGRFQGLDRFAARKKIVAELEEQGALVEVEERLTPVVRAERSKEIIEYRLSNQWFVKVRPLAEKALESFETGTPDFFPARWGQVYRFWLENLKDWCISRQIWWGHRIPAWHHRESGEILVSEIEPAQVSADTGQWEQDPDVLDTWFSSNLWPFSVFGWPSDDSTDLKRFYPTDVLVTAKDIIFLWVARMMMSGLFHLDEAPFSQVFINSVVCDEDGETMSKSKGNGIDPLHVMDGASLTQLQEPVYEARPLEMEKLLKRVQSNFPDGFEGVGADALRFALLTLNSEAQQVSISLKRFEEIGRPFNDKLWNACRFVMSQLDLTVDSAEEIAEPALEDRWILGQLDSCIAKLRNLLDEHRLSAAFETVYRFFWDDLCDWYLELVKFRLRGGVSSDIRRVQLTLGELLAAVIRALHPAVPFITEELWHHLLPKLEEQGLLVGTLKELEGQSICAQASYPTDSGRYVGEQEELFERLKQIVRAVRSIRLESGIEKKVKLSAFYLAESDASDNLFSFPEHLSIIIRMAQLEQIETVSNLRPELTTVVVAGVELHLDLDQHRDLEAEIARHNKTLESLSKKISSAEIKLGNPKFVERAPSEVVEKERSQLKEAVEQRGQLEKVISELKVKIG